MSKPDWLVQLEAAAFRAGKSVKPAAFRQTPKGLVVSRLAMWKYHNPIVLARWDDGSFLVVLDGRNRWRGTLMLCRGNAAVQVTASVETLESTYAPHQELRWWRFQTLHRCEAVERSA